MDISATVVNVNSQTIGRDKLCRMFQYGSKAVWGFIQNKFPDENDWIQKFKNLEYSLSTARKVLRFGKSYDVLFAALRTIRFQDLTLRLIVTMFKITLAMFLFVDNVILLGRFNLVKIDQKLWSSMSNKCWLTMIILKLTRDVNEIYIAVMKEVIYQEKKKEIVRKHYSTSHIKPNQAFTEILIKSLIENNSLLIDCIRNVSDVVIPMSYLGYITLTPGVQGLCGVVSSIMGLLPVINPMLQLMPY